MVPIHFDFLKRVILAVLIVLAICVVSTKGFSVLQGRMLWTNRKPWVHGAERLFSKAEVEVEDKTVDDPFLPDLSSLSDMSLLPENNDPEEALVTNESTFSNDDDADPYAHILDLKAPVGGDAVRTLVAATSIAEGGEDEGLALRASRAPKPPPQWEHWDEFMEEEFGDMDRELTEEEDKWVLELRDAVELKRGQPFTHAFITLPPCTRSLACLYILHVSHRKSSSLYNYEQMHTLFFSLSPSLFLSPS